MLRADDLATNNDVFYKYDNCYDYEAFPFSNNKGNNITSTHNQLWFVVINVYMLGAQLVSERTGLTTEEAIDDVDLSNTGASANISNPKKQLNDLRKHMGFNISELARILKVQRPTIYEWLESKAPSTKNQIRIDLIYTFCQEWIKKEVGKLGRYMYRQVTQDDRCLIDLLEEETINNAQVINTLNIIAASLLKAISERAKRDELLKLKGFKPRSKEEQRSRLMRLTRKISL